MSYATKAIKDQEGYATKFQIGQAVKLADTVRHPQYAGLAGTVKRVIKSRNVVGVEVNLAGRFTTYEAIPNNVIAI
jgi:transcription antitermination factor NusG